MVVRRNHGDSLGPASGTSLLLDTGRAAGGAQRCPRGSPVGEWGRAVTEEAEDVEGEQRKCQCSAGAERDQGRLPGGGDTRTTSSSVSRG